MRSPQRLRHLSPGPSTRRHRRASRRAALALEWLEVRWVPTTLGPLGGVAVPAAIVGTPPPTIDSITNNGPVAAGTPVTLHVAAEAADGVTGPLTYQFDFFDDGNFEVTNQSGVASWTYDTPGVQVIDVRVTDALGDQGDALTFVIVTPPAPTVTPPADQPAVEATSTEFALGRFSQADGTGPWNVTVDWGDGSPDSKFAATAAGDLGSLPHAYARYGDYKVTVTVGDGVSSGSAKFAADVADVAPTVAAPPDRSATEGTAASFALGSFSDPGSDSPWHVTVDWGDQTTSTFTATTAGGLGSLPHTYAKYSDYTVTVTVNDGRLAGSAKFGADVSDVTPAVTAPGDQKAVEGSSSSFSLGGFADPGSESPWTVTVDWGDDTPATVFGAGTTGGLGSQPHTYAKYGTYQVTVTVGDGQLTGSATFHADVADVPPYVSGPADQAATEGSTTSVPLGQFANLGVDAPWTVTVDWGDLTPASTFTATSAGSLGSLPHDYATYGTYVVTVTVDDGRHSGLATFLENVADVAPTVTAPADQTEALGTSASLALGQFSDPGADLLWVATVDWGDESAPTSFLATSTGDLGSLAHEFPGVGTYTVTVTVGDGRAAGSATFLATVPGAEAPPVGGTGPSGGGGEPFFLFQSSGPTFDPLGLIPDVPTGSAGAVPRPGGAGRPDAVGAVRDPDLDACRPGLPEHGRLGDDRGPGRPGRRGGQRRPGRHRRGGGRGRGGPGEGERGLRGAFGRAHGRRRGRAARGRVRAQSHDDHDDDDHDDGPRRRGAPGGCDVLPVGPGRRPEPRRGRGDDGRPGARLHEPAAGAAERGLHLWPLRPPRRPLLDRPGSSRAWSLAMAVEPIRTAEDLAPADRAPAPPAPEPRHDEMTDDTMVLEMLLYGTQEVVRGSDTGTLGAFAALAFQQIRGKSEPHHQLGCGFLLFSVLMCAWSTSRPAAPTSGGPSRSSARPRTPGGS